MNKNKKQFISLTKNKNKKNFNPSYSYDINKPHFEENYFLPQFLGSKESNTKLEDSKSESENNSIIDKENLNEKINWISYSDFLIKLFMKKGIYNRISFKYFFIDFGQFMMKLKEKLIVNLYFENKAKVIKNFSIVRMEEFLEETVLWTGTFISISKKSILNFLNKSRVNIVNN